MNTNDIQKLIDDLPSSGGLIQLPVGVHEITSPLLLNKSFVEIRGIGTGGGWCNQEQKRGAVTLEWDGPSADFMLKIDGPKGSISGVKVSGICFDCNGKVGAMELRSLVKCSIEDIMIFNVRTPCAISMGISEIGGGCDCHGTVLRNITGCNYGNYGTALSLLKLQGGNDWNKCHVTKCIFDHIERVGNFFNTIYVGPRVQTNKFRDISAVGSCIGYVVIVDGGSVYGDTCYDNVFDGVMSDEDMVGVKLGACRNTVIEHLGTGRVFVATPDAINWSVSWNDGTRRKYEVR